MVSNRSVDERRIEALGKTYETRTIEDWIVILYSIYKDHNITSGPYDLWLQAVNDASQLAETIRREIIRTKFPSETSVHTQLARLFCRISAFVGRYLYDHQSVGADDPIGGGLAGETLDDYIGGEEKYEKWILLKYPYSCPTCGTCPCVCASYRNIMENRGSKAYSDFWSRKRKKFIHQKERYSYVDGDLSHATKEMYEKSIDDWVRVFYDIYASSHIEVSLESIAFHFLEEVGEVSDGLLCIDELHKYRSKVGVYCRDTADLDKSIITQAKQEPKYAKFLDEYKRRRTGDEEREPSDNAYQYLLQINMNVVKEELADVLTWMCAILNKISAMYKHWNPDGKLRSMSDVLHGRYQRISGEVGCLYCSRAICAPDCLIESTIRKSIIKRTEKLEHRLFS